MACQSGSDTEANYIAANRWTIGYDEFGYAKVYNDNVAWVQNASGNWVQPYAVNISAALAVGTARARHVTGSVGGVHEHEPAAYPISAYSYILVQCAPTPARPTCTSAYPNQGIANTMAQFMDYVACAGQIHMADIGYAPSHPNCRNSWRTPSGGCWANRLRQLSASNCSNPTFSGSLGAGASPPPVPPIGNAPGGSGPSASSGKASGAGAGGSVTATPSASLASGSGSGSSGTGGGAGTTGGTAKSAGGGSSDVKPPNPAALGSNELPTSSWVPLLALLIVLALPVVILSINRKRRPT